MKYKCPLDFEFCFTFTLFSFYFLVFFFSHCLVSGSICTVSGNSAYTDSCQEQEFDTPVPAGAIAGAVIAGVSFN
jgi:hypothetical protein